MLRLIPNSVVGRCLDYPEDSSESECLGRRVTRGNHGDTLSLALPACSLVLEVRTIAAVSSADLRIVRSPSFSSLSGGGDILAKAQQPCECLRDRALTSFDAKTTTPSRSVAVIANDAVGEAVVSNSYAQGFVLPIAHLLEGFDPLMSPISGVPSDGRAPDGSGAMLVVIGHRGDGKNKTLPVGGIIPEASSRSSIRENTIASFNLAARNGAQFVEFDVQVTKDGVPVIFHDDMIITDGAGPGRHICNVTLEEFRAIGPQRDAAKVGQALYRRAADGTLTLWTADVEDSMCTLAEAFREVQPGVGFNIELKFDDDGSTSDEELQRVIRAVLADVQQCARGRMLYFSSFHPDAVRLLRQQLPVYPVFFLTAGGITLYHDGRRNSIEAAIEVCREGHLQGIVSEVKAVLQRPEVVALVKAEGLFFFTYGELNNVGEAVLKQRSWGIDGVIVDHVSEVVRVARHGQESKSSTAADASVQRRSVSVV